VQEENAGRENGTAPKVMKKIPRDYLESDFQRIYNEYIAAGTEGYDAADADEPATVDIPVLVEPTEEAVTEDVFEDTVPYLPFDPAFEDEEELPTPDFLAEEEAVDETAPEESEVTAEEFVREDVVEAVELEVAPEPVDATELEIAPELEPVDTTINVVEEESNESILDDLLGTEYEPEEPAVQANAENFPAVEAPAFYDEYFEAKNETPEEEVFAEPVEAEEVSLPDEENKTFIDTITEDVNDRLLDDVIESSEEIPEEEDLDTTVETSQSFDEEEEDDFVTSPEEDFVPAIIDEEETVEQTPDEPIRVIMDAPAPQQQQPTERVIEREIIREIVVMGEQQAQDLGYRPTPDQQHQSFPSRPSEPIAHVSTPNAPAERETERELSNSERDAQRYDEAMSRIDPKETARIKAESERKAKEDFKKEQQEQKAAALAAKAKNKRGLFSRGRKDAAAVEEVEEKVVQPIKIHTENYNSFEDPNYVPEMKIAEPVVTTKKRSSLFSSKTDPAVEVGEDGIDPQTWLENTILTALKQNASDLHISIHGETKNLTARIRVDGAMQDFATVEGVKARVIMGRLKAATELSSSGSFAPEETIYTIELDGEKRKARAVIFRTEDGGEALVMRLPLTGRLKELHELKFSEKNLNHFYDLLASPSKLIMIAGPMGSGKTTTAHGAMLHVSTTDRTVWTIEDPVERKLPNTVQLEIDEENGAGFDVLLSKLLRADYNTLFLGEIRDHATAAAGVRQAKAGRQVMSTIHANNNVTALLRLIELAQDSALSVLDSVRGVVSQRLVRALNPAWDGVDPKKKYAGRLPIHEVLFVNDNLIEVMMQNKPLTEIKQAAMEAAGSTFIEDCERLLAAGLTDEEEIRRVIGDNK